LSIEAHIGADPVAEVARAAVLLREQQAA
jgi:hypothetical protein